ncbi:MAG TPA: PmoA family protein [Bryobacteraceae bacterium]|jgi:hypothetical protein
MTTRFVWLLTALTLALPAQVRFRRASDRIQVEIGGKPYTNFFLSADGNKPYLYPLSTASGVVVTRHFPMEEFLGETHDHPHQRGLFFSHGEISGTNFWATERVTDVAHQGRMELKKILELKDGDKSGTIRAIFTGMDDHGKPLMTETRTITFRVEPALRIIDYEIDVEAIEKLVFADTKEGTFGIRLATSMTEDKGPGRMVNAEGGVGEKQVWGKRSPWVDYSGPVGEKTVGVAIFDNPANPHHPTYWHSRAYGLFAANPFGARDFTGDKSQDGSMTVEPGKTVTFRYRVVIHEGDAKSAGIAGMWREYSKE